MSVSSHGTDNTRRYTSRGRRRRASLLALAFGSALALGSLGGIAGAAHDAYRHLSAGQVNGNGAFNADFRGASADGSRVIFHTNEQLVAADADSSQDVYERSGGQTKLISVGAINGNGAFDAKFQAASADGTRAFFHTDEQLVAADTDSAQDIYERSGGQTKRVSAGQVNGNGTFNGASFKGASADGTRVFFETGEPLIAADTDTADDIYERSGGSTKRVSTGAINGNGPFDARFDGASADGTRVFFNTPEQLISGDTDAEVDVYERSGGSTKRVSTGAINGNGAFDAFFEGASADGSRVFFVTNEALVSADTEISRDLYERSGGTTTRVSAGQVNGNGAFNANFQGASADGTRVFFRTHEQLVAADTDSSQDVYERSPGSTKRVSAGAINGNGAVDAVFDGASADGTRVFFHTNERLVSADGDRIADIYERFGGNTKQVSAGQVNGNGAFNATFAGASADGLRLFYLTAERLVTADTDTSQDVYERSGGATTKVSPGNGAFAAAFDGASADGSGVFFSTGEKVIASDEDSVADIYGAYISP